MDRQRRRHDQALPLNRNLADNVLSGALPPDDLPPALGPMAKFVEALRPVQQADLPPSGRDGLTIEAMTSFLATSARHPAKWRGSAAGRAVPRRVAGFRVRLATAMVAAGLAFLVGAAYAGRLPAPAQNAVSIVLSKVGLSVPHDAGDDASKDESGQHDGAVGPDATGPAHDGLCNAYFNGNGGSEGGKLDSVAFQNVRQSAEDAGQTVEEFCGVDAATPEAKDHGKGHEGKDKGSDSSHGESGDDSGSDEHGQEGSGKDHGGQGSSDESGSGQGSGSDDGGVSGTDASGSGDGS
jgi:hypothetical protein